MNCDTEFMPSYLLLNEPGRYITLKKHLFEVVYTTRAVILHFAARFVIIDAIKYMRVYIFNWKYTAHMELLKTRRKTVLSLVSLHLWTRNTIMNY